MRWGYSAFLLIPALVIGTESGCGSNNGTDDLSSVPVSFTTIDAVPDTTVVSTPIRIDIDQLNNTTERNTLWLHSITPGVQVKQTNW